MTTTKTEAATKVIFRTFKDGVGTIALFPEIPATMQPWHCQSYMQAGQHSAASVDLISVTRPATAEEIRPLAKELKRLGYKLRVVRKFTQGHFQTRSNALAAMRNR